MTKENLRSKILHAQAEVDVSAPDTTGRSEGTTYVLGESMARHDKVKTLVEHQPQRCKGQKFINPFWEGAFLRGR